MKKNWAKGLFNFVLKREKRSCARKECKNGFEVMFSDPRIYCSSSCSARVNNHARKLSQATKDRIRNSLRGRPNPMRGIEIVPREEIICANPECQKLFTAIQTAERKFCKRTCLIRFVGKKPTSPKAARGKAGIRKDIDDKSYFFSRWEANMARLFNYQGIKWIHQPRSFDLKTQNYTPDFYLPDQDIYIEVKNFLSDYSKSRDDKFRELYPRLRLKMILKDEYMKLENQYSGLIKNWEFSNSKFSSQ